MTSVSRTYDTFAAHAVCAAAGARDGLRATHFFMRDLANADAWGKTGAGSATALSRLVSRLARMADGFMTWSTNIVIALILPQWRKLPSPFAAGMVNEVADAIRRNSLVHNPLFNAYFFRAAKTVLERYAAPPSLVFEHRVDAARRRLAAEAPSAGKAQFLARGLIALSEAAPIARHGAPKSELLSGADANVAVWAIACIALLFAEDGRPSETLGEDEFFAVVAALIAPRLGAIAELIRAGDAEGLAEELEAVRGMY
jgi:hypothetical protein